MSYSITYTEFLTHLSETGEPFAEIQINAMHVTKMNK